MIVGLKEAAKFLGYDKPDSFRRARERWMENNNTEGLPGEYRVGRSPAWTEESLTEWKKSLPRRGKR